MLFVQLITLLSIFNSFAQAQHILKCANNYCPIGPTGVPNAPTFNGYITCPDTFVPDTDPFFAGFGTTPNSDTDVVDCSDDMVISPQGFLIIRRLWTFPQACTTYRGLRQAFMPTFSTPRLMGLCSLI